MKIKIEVLFPTKENPFEKDQLDREPLYNSQVHSRHISIHNFLVNLVSMLAAYCFFDNRPDALYVFYIEDNKKFALY